MKTIIALTLLLMLNGCPFTIPGPDDPPPAPRKTSISTLIEQVKF